MAPKSADACLDLLCEQQQPYEHHMVISALADQGCGARGGEEISRCMVGTRVGQQQVLYTRVIAAAAAAAKVTTHNERNS